MRRVQVIAAGAAALLAIAGCSSNQPEVAQADPAWINTVEMLRARAEQLGSNQLVFDILEDGEITPAEMQESMVRANQCLEDLSIDVGGGLRGGFSWESPDGRREWGFHVERTSLSTNPSISPDEELDLAFACEDYWSAGLVDAWVRRQSSGGNEPTSDMIADCLSRHDLVPPGFTGAELEVLVDEQQPPDTCDEALQDPRFVDVTCFDGGGFTFSPNPDYELESAVLADPPNLHGGQAQTCILFPGS